MYTSTCALILVGIGHVCIPHARADREVVHFVPIWDAGAGRLGIGESAVYRGGIELFKKLAIANYLWLLGPMYSQYRRFPERISGSACA
jgi:hypothetical protein